MSGPIDTQAPPPDPWRWWYVTVTVAIMIVFAAIAAGFFFGPDRWSQGNSISIIHHHTAWLPLPAWGAVFLLVTVLLGSGHEFCLPHARIRVPLGRGRGVACTVGGHVIPRLLGYTIGLGVAAFFSLTAVLFSLTGSEAPPSAVPDTTIRPGTTPPVIPLHTNIVTLGLSLLALLILAAGMRYTIEANEERSAR